MKNIGQKVGVKILSFPLERTLAKMLFVTARNYERSKDPLYFYYVVTIVFNTGTFS